MTLGARLALAAKVAVSAIVSWIVVTQFDLDTVLDHLARADNVYIFLSCLTLPIVTVLSAWRWQILAGGLLDFGRTLKYSWIWVFYAHLLPGTVTADVAKGASLAAKDKDVRVSMLPVSIVMDRVVGLFTLLLFADIACFALYFWFEDAFMALRMVALAVFVLTTATLVFGPIALAVLHRVGRLEALATRGKIFQAVASVAETFASYGRGEGVGKLCAAVGISIATHALNTVGLLLGYLAIGGENGVAAVIAYPILTLALFFPASVSGIGIREVALIPVFQLISIDAETAIALSWINLAAAVPSILVGVALQIHELYRR